MIQLSIIIPIYNEEANIPPLYQRLKKVINRTALQLNVNLSRRYNCNVYLKREDLQILRSYKLRGAYNMMSTLHTEQLLRGVVCVSAGNHAQALHTVVIN